jgi:hypothetical protein
MTSLAETILPLCLTAFAMLWVFNFLYMRKAGVLFTYLKQFHPKIWEELGRPTPFRNNSPSCQMKLLHYLKDRKFAPESDPELIRLCRGMRSMMSLGAIGIVVILVGFFIIAGGGMASHTK